MDCNEKEVKAKCLETRKKNGMTWRRYRSPGGSTFTTYEVPVQVLSAVGKRRLAEELERAKRTQERDDKNFRALQLVGGGWKAAAAANEVGVCDSQVRKLRAKQAGLEKT